VYFSSNAGELFKPESRISRLFIRKPTEEEAAEDQLHVVIVARDRVMRSLRY
jgi:hypothetical protein